MGTALNTKKEDLGSFWLVYVHYSMLHEEQQHLYYLIFSILSITYL